MGVEDAALRAVENLLERPEGPLAFRLIVQPLMATLIGVRDGLRDARSGERPYGLQIVLPSARRGEAWRHGLRASARVVIFALLLDTAYQLWFLRAFYPGEALLVAITIGYLPYLLVRGPTTRIAFRWIHKEDAPPE